MKLHPFLMFVTTVLLAIARADLVFSADDERFGLQRRIPWTTSRVVGSPDPPLPYKVEPIFTRIKWDRPIYVKAEPGANDLLVIEQGGEKNKPSKILRLSENPEAEEAQPVLQLDGRLVYALEFHPDYHNNGHLFIFSNGPTGRKERTNRISRFIVSSTEPRELVLASEQTIIEWRSMGHDGGDLVFGHDGMLYIASGDGTADSDRWLSAQDISNLLGAVLRIDVDRPDPDRHYSIPRDNPFLDQEKARGEIWAFGLRNPWRMSIDAKSGRIWVGNNGQDLWETAHVVRRGDNYGWSVYEGNHPFYLHRQMGPAPFVPPTIEHHHTEARSLTGGVVYDGPRFQELAGAYVYGDYSTGKIWGAHHDGTRITWHRELADTTLQIAGFALSHGGELLVIDNGGGLYRLVVNEPNLQATAFPTRLSETGLFKSIEEHQVQSGVIAYAVNAPGWNDDAHVERFMAIPDDLKIDYTSSRGWTFPNGTVLLQTLSVRQGASALRRIESRLLTRQQGEWAGYSYRWNADQDDAMLVSRQGETTAIGPLADEQDERLNWRFPSRAECMSCHSRAANFVLGMSEAQMNLTHDYGAVADNQLRVFDHIGLFRGKLPKPAVQLKRLVNPYDPSQDVGERARAYLHANCSSCHVEAGGGNSRMEFEFDKSLKDMQVVAIHPQHDTFGIDQAMLVAPGEPDRSILFQRIRRRGRGQMPPLVSQRVDEKAVELFRDWIGQMPPERKFVKDWQADDLRPLLQDVFANRSFLSGRASFRTAGCIQCHRFQGEGGGAGPDLTGLGDRLRPAELLESVVLPSAKIAAQYATSVLVLDDGRSLQGRIESETDTQIVLRTDASFATPTKVDKADVEERYLSKKSSMPEGTLNGLEQHEILNLLAYLLTSGDRNHVAFAASQAESAE